MKYIPGVATSPEYLDTIPTVELSRRNLETLLDRLDEPESSRTLVSPGHHIRVRAVENEEHYRDREPGPIYMPSTGEYR